MNSISVTVRPDAASWDVIVVGGGPAGCAAAIAAARQGASTLLVERTCSLGGMGTSALVPAWCPFSDRKRSLFRGIAEEILNLSKEGTPHVPADQIDWVVIDAEHLKRVYEDLVSRAGAEILFDTFLVGVEKDEQSVARRIIVANKAGLTALSAKVFIDATGDADLTAFAGGSFDKGDNETGDLQPATHCFVLANVNEKNYLALPKLNGRVGSEPSLIERIMESGRYPEIPDAHLCHGLLGGGCVGFNAGHLYEVDNTDPNNVSYALIKGRRLAKAYRDALREFCPEAFGHAHLVQTGSLLGTRETRRIVGDYTLTIEDYLARRSFPDEICRNAYFIDIHLSKQEARKHKDWEAVVHTRFRQYDPGESHGIPYRCLLPRTLKNVIVAGRSISTDRIVQGSVRTMPACLAMGEAAGTAAATAARTLDGDVHQVDTSLLRERLRSNGGYLPGLAVEDQAETLAS